MTVLNLEWTRFSQSSVTISHIWGTSEGKTFHFTFSFQDFPIHRIKTKAMILKNVQSQPPEMRYEMVLTAQVHSAAEIPEPGSGIQVLPCVIKHMRASPIHISLKIQFASRPVNPAVTVSEQRATFPPLAVRFLIRHEAPFTWKVYFAALITG